MAAIDPVHAKLVLSGLEECGEHPEVDDPDELLTKLENHMTTQPVKEVATPSASNATKRAQTQGVKTADGS